MQIRLIWYLEDFPLDDNFTITAPIPDRCLNTQNTMTIKQGQPTVNYSKMIYIKLNYDVCVCISNVVHVIKMRSVFRQGLARENPSHSPCLNYINNYSRSGYEINTMNAGTGFLIHVQNQIFDRSKRILWFRRNTQWILWFNQQEKQQQHYVWDR